MLTANEKYLDDLKKTWGSQRMVDFCLKKVSQIVDLEKDKILIIEKQSIKKDFCFGFGWNGISSEEEQNNANNMARYASENKEYFIKENIKDLDKVIRMLQKNLKSSLKNLYTLPCCDGGDCFTVYLENIDCYEIESPRYANAVILSDSDCKTLLEAYEREKEKRIKKINSYLKRYGLSKVNTWTYLVD